LRRQQAAASPEQIQLIQPNVFFFLLLDVGANRCFIAPDGIHKIPSRPKMLPNEPLAKLSGVRTIYII
jgi:hypothetical protein